jgi:hypothetical protein
MSRHARIVTIHMLTLVSWVGLAAACVEDSDGVPLDAEVVEAGADAQSHRPDASQALDASRGDSSVPVSREEGALCVEQGDCTKGLRCVETTDGSVSVGVCARPCDSGEQCEDAELCYAYTQDPNDAHCVDLVTKQYARCGVGLTSRCDGRTCLYFPKAITGLCIDLCDLAPDDAGADDAGVTAQCEAEQSCIPGIVDSTERGLCGRVVPVGAKCGVQSGRFCGTGDACVPDDRQDDDSPRHCRADCADDGKCPKGTTCRGIVGQSAFCY